MFGAFLCSKEFERKERKMDFEQFKENVKNDLEARFRTNGTGDVDISYGQITKPNETYEAITVRGEDDQVGVNLNVTRMYEAMQEGDSYLDVFQKAAETIERGLEQMPEFNITKFQNYEQMKDTLVMEVVSIEGNQELLSNVPHDKIEDMAVIYRFEVMGNEDGRGTVLVTNALLDQYGIDTDQLKADALSVAPDNKPAVIKSMTETMMEIMGEDMFGDLGLNIPDEDEKMFVATVPDKIHGAGVIAYPDFMEQASEKLGGDFYILPSSLHEVLLVKDNCDMSLHELKQMVQEVNETQVSPEEKLTDNVYHYDSQDKVFEIGDKFELRQATRVMEESYGMDDKSVLKDLASKKIDAKSNAIQSSSSKDVLDKGVHKQKAGESL